MQTNESESFTFRFRTMKRVFFLLGILALGMTVLLFSNGSTAAAEDAPEPIYVWEDIDANTTWESGSVHIVNASGPISVTDGAVLTIEPGAQVLFENGTGLIVEDGKLIADASGNPALIVFSANFTDPYRGIWNGIWVSEAGSAEFNNVAIRYARTAITCDNGTVGITDVTITSVLNGVDIYKDTDALEMSIVGLTITDYDGVGVSVWAQNETLDLEMTDCLLSGMSGSVGVSTTSADELTGASTITLNNVTITGGLNAVEALATTDLEMALNDCAFNAQDGVAVTAEAVYGDSDVVMEGTTIDGTNADDSMTYYTVDADESYEFQMIEPDPANRTNTGGSLHAVLPWDFYFGGSPYTDVYMYEGGYVEVGGWWNLIAPCQYSNFATNGGSSFIGYVIDDEKAVFQWAVYDISDASDRMDVFQMVLFANGDIQFVYDMMETDAVGESYIDSFGWFFTALNYDVDMVVGNPFDLEYTSYTLHPESVSPGAGMYIASSEGNVNLDANDSVVRNFGDGAIWAYAQMGDITEQITNCQFWYIVSGVEDGAIDAWTEDGNLNVEMTDNVFFTVWGWAFAFESSNNMGGAETIVVTDNRFTRCAGVGLVSTFVDDYEDAEIVDLEFTADRWFNDNILIDCSILMTSLNVFAENSGWNITLNEQMIGNQYTTIAYSGMMPFLVDQDLDGDAMMSSWLNFYDWDGVSANNVWHTLTVTDNTFDGMPTFMGYDGDYYTSAPKAVEVMELFNTDGSLSALESDLEISGNTIMAGGAEPEVLIDVYRDLYSYDGDRTCMLDTVVRDNQLGSNGVDGVYITLWEGAGGNDAGVASVMTNNSVTVLGNILTGCGLVADLMFYHNGVNLVGETSYFDALIFQDNVMEDCAGMLTVNDYYYGGFDDFYPVWGTPISSVMEAEYWVQVQNNTFVGNAVGDGNYVNAIASVGVPGDAIYCNAEATVTGSVKVVDNSMTLMVEDGNLSASAEYALAVDQSFYASGRNAVMDANISADVNDNVITGDTLFSGILVSTGAYASTSDLRADLPDHSMVTLVANVEVLRNQIEGAFGGISVEHYASATNAMSEVHDTYDATISDNSVSASVWGIWAYVSDSTHTESLAGSPTMDGEQIIVITANDVNGMQEAYGIQVRLMSDYGYMGSLTGSVDFSVTDNKVVSCKEGISVEMYPDPAQDQSLLVQDNILSDCGNNGIFVSGGVVDINGNTLTDGSGYGIYVQNAQGSVADNTVSGFPYSGIQINYCYDMAVTGNSITACAADDDWGMYLVNGENLSVIGNSIVGNYRGLYAIYLEGSSIFGNNITGSTFEGVVLFKLSACQVENNIISDNGAYGVNIYGGYDVVFGNNTVWNNEGIGVDIDAGTDDQIWVYNGWYEYNDGYGIYVEAEPFSPGVDWFGVQWIIDGESRLTFNEVYYDGEITVRSGGSLYLDSLDCFQVRGSSVDGTATLLVEEGGMLWMLNTNVMSDLDDDVFEPMSALGGPVNSYYEFIVYGVLKATECSILHAESIYLGPTSDAELVGCLIADYERSGVNVDGCSPIISRCIIIGNSMGEPSAEGIVIEGEDAYPQITGCLIIANCHGIYARNTDLGAVYDNIFLLNQQAGIYGEAVEGRIHDNVFMLNKVEILLTDSNVTITDNQIGWAKMIDDLAQYAPFIELVGHHLFGLMDSDEDLLGTEGDLLDSGLFGLDVTDMLMGHVGVMAMGCERLVMTGNWYGMLYQAVYVMDCPDLIFGDRIEPSNLTIPYYVGLNSSTMTVPIQCIEGLYAVRCDVNLVNAYIEVLDDAVVAQDCTGSVINSALKGGDKNLLVVPSAPAAGAEGGSFEVKTILKVHAEEDDGDKVTEAKVLVLNALGATVARGETDLNGDFVCTVVSYVVTANGKDSSMNPYKVSVDFDNGNVSKDVTAADPLDGTWETSTTITADADNTWIFAGICVLAIVIILIVVALIMRKKKA